MTIICQICKEVLHGPTPAATILGSIRAAYEFAALYPAMAQHVQRRHPELGTIITAMMDQFALALASNTFTASDTVLYAELQNQVQNAVWAAVNFDWQIIPGNDPMARGIMPKANSGKKLIV